MKNPLISIVVPCYNQAQYLDAALQSVLDQTYSNWECLIVDDGSPDNTKEVASQWVAKDERFSYLHKVNGGLCSARNFGIEAANGEFILPLDADDKIGKEYLSKGIEVFLKDSSLKVVYCKAEKFGDASGVWELPQFSLHNLSRSNMIFCTALFRKEDWKKTGGYDENMGHGWEDWEFWISLLKNGGNVHQLDYQGFYYRIKAGSMLLEIDAEKSKELLEYISVKHADFFVKHYGSFKSLEHKKLYLKREFESNLKSEKFVTDAFLKKFFRFTLFGTQKKQR
ncbi:glycosyltransferase family 2 protein [Ulvibacter antarcticus]|uniref:Glycosyltransferase involved in cell wall biosynthesis n=1 Tax=Ulvibacter antarcticus TaxID=442714 RepID=A0A3L9YIK2_9FLAO|nr:glycosyltransferase family A protein [Ulvibacter antarcticus]RMA57975.1 glycosyltransferase involved in cell wall biosynthesis [Ulvibacter antarcticus]